ncbi:MAG TPA: membrane or secreted protein [Flavisolibacter sp.]|nr:membrane or secreted protein [Flavisolibacter sp.]
MKRARIAGMCCLVLVFCWQSSMAQSKRNKNLVYVDKQGILRWTEGGQEASFFGVNYTVPFAYGYRSHKALGTDLEKAIDADVYHMARLGLDAFRVHVWDVEITDSLGNLVENEHLRLFDYLIKKLKERNIRIMLTPIAFWGNGYPERDEKTNGFSSVYGKERSVVLEPAIRAQENYIRQLLNHRNPYTGYSYKDDPDIIAAEINNEPQHSGPKKAVTSYVNRLAAAIRSTGWTKPVFYNISESPSYADAVTAAKVDGFSFQWYPTGLVANREQKGNLLPTVDRYAIPFFDTIPAFRKKARMVYEFDAGDVMQPIMYPAMARSFRTAGFQWATQFAYDPMATAYGNTEYQTHYLNLAYTPAKAISLLIAARAFHRLPRNGHYGHFPADTAFDVFRVSYSQQLSEMNTREEFYYTGSTATMPESPSGLEHLAGVGESPVASYTGTGAYFLDKISRGLWRLEIMPDAIPLQDPFAKASPSKMVTAIEWKKQTMTLSIPDLGRIIHIKGLDSNNSFDAIFYNGKLELGPGVYLLSRSAERAMQVKPDSSIGSIGLKEFYAPPSMVDKPFVSHQPLAEFSAGLPFIIRATVAGVDSMDKLDLELRHSAGGWKTIPLQRKGTASYMAAVPAEMTLAGILNYRIIIQKKDGRFYVFPGGHTGNPYAWDYLPDETWRSLAVSKGAPLLLFDAAGESRPVFYNPDWRNNTHLYTTGGNGRELVLRSSINKPAAGQLLGWQHYFADKLEGRIGELPGFSRLVVKGRSDKQRKIKVSLILKDGSAFSSELLLDSSWSDHFIPLDHFSKSSMLLLPRPYPGFHPLHFSSTGGAAFDPASMEKLEISFEAEEQDRPAFIEIRQVRLEN